jgi:hypothetical protein
MSEDKQGGEIHELAGGWITERKGTKVPGFLKLAYVVFSLFGIVYLFRYWSGEVAHETRGPLVRQMNAIIDTPGGVWLGLMAACVGLFALGLLWFVFLHRAED